MSNSMMTEQQKKAVIKIVRRSLKGLCNEAPSPEDEAQKILQACSIKFIGAKIMKLGMERKLLNRHVKRYQVSRRVGRGRM